MSPTDTDTRTDLTVPAADVDGSRRERVTAWVGWRLPELIALGGTGVAGVLHWPGWWAATAAAAGWIAYSRAAPHLAPHLAAWRERRARRGGDDETDSEIEPAARGRWKETG
ncbi:hypothetical protein [Prauserella alba]|uniref:Uncharacterized protein n=1 Tax=Prauserella alba TaxID=176898 RepID=A0ABP4G0C2_9PSEU|nr:hypothetical protein [Prauserella alba]MCP2180028.1 hypothetical protein [Prauserella alba]